MEPRSRDSGMSNSEDLRLMLVSVIHEVEDSNGTVCIHCKQEEPQDYHKDYWVTDSGEELAVNLNNSHGSTFTRYVYCKNHIIESVQEQ